MFYPILNRFRTFCKTPKYIIPPKLRIPHLNPTPLKKPAKPVYLYILPTIFLALSILKS